jgi:plasmid stabilization system protein ParE
MYKVIRSITARKELKDIARFIAQNDHFRAVSFTKELIETTKTLLSLFPK